MLLYFYLKDAFIDSTYSLSRSSLVFFLFYVICCMFSSTLAFSLYFVALSPLFYLGRALFCYSVCLIHSSPILQCQEVSVETRLYSLFCSLRTVSPLAASVRSTIRQERSFITFSCLTDKMHQGLGCTNEHTHPSYSYFFKALELFYHEQSLDFACSLFSLFLLLTSLPIAECRVQLQLFFSSCDFVAIR